jgi:hypothetical protein
MDSGRRLRELGGLSGSETLAKIRKVQVSPNNINHESKFAFEGKVLPGEHTPAGELAGGFPAEEEDR